MSDTKEQILLVALRLFARDGYEAVSVSQIAGEIGMVKSALYKHYKSKRDIFDSILKRMQEMDYEQAVQFDVPEGTIEEMAEKYRQTSWQSVGEFTEAQFIHWTEDEFAMQFRRMLTLEQFRNSEMADLYQQYLCVGPLAYMEDLFANMAGRGADAREMALSFYSPMFLLYSLYDAAQEADRPAVKEMLHRHVQKFIMEHNVGCETRISDRP